MSQPHTIHEAPRNLVGHLRDWLEALTIAFIVAMLVRAFVFELFRVPSGSMSPTIIGDIACEVDVDGNGELDQVVVHTGFSDSIQVFYRLGGVFHGVDVFNRSGAPLATSGASGARVKGLSPTVRQLIDLRMAPRYDRILVNKFAYWFSPTPQRGDIMVFKVPPREFKVERPIYIKRVAGLPGETVEIGGHGELIADGEPVTQPEVHSRTYYVRRGDYYSENGGRMKVPDDSFLAFGDNSYSSQDSRFWGPVPLANLKGKAFLRYLPLNKIGFLE